jgi:6-phosphogluconate dehydrogenase
MHMTLGMIGLGRMGANMTDRLVRGSHRVVGYARKQEARERVEAKGAESAASLVATLATPPSMRSVHFARLT